MKSATVKPSGVTVGPAILRHLHSDLLQHQVTVTPDANLTPVETAWSLNLARAAAHLDASSDLDSLWWVAPDLLQWLQVQRLAHYNGWLSTRRFTSLEQLLPGWLDTPPRREGAQTTFDPSSVYGATRRRPRDVS